MKVCVKKYRTDPSIIDHLLLPNVPTCDVTKVKVKAVLLVAPFVM